MQHRIIANSVVDPGWYPLTHGEPCWLWMGSRIKGSSLEYPSISIRWKSGPRKGRRRSTGGHRESLRAFNKGLQLTKRMLCEHECNVSLCVNPAHLKGGTYRTNNRKTVADGRHWPGSKGKKPK